MTHLGALASQIAALASQIAALASQIGAVRMQQDVAGRAVRCHALCA
jgi:outer membrane murein-binding lipoprotein Lpp